ncbi:MAG: hypothetical protein JNL83_34455 [Myxococcales bacterium]|nr:hypothetical protein [Myxococcales bacterium]
MRSPTVIFAALAAAAAPVAAQPIEHPSQVDSTPADPSVSLEVVNTAELDAGALGAAISAELGIPVSDPTAFAPGRGRLSVAIIDGAARIAYEPAAGSLVERLVVLPADPRERIELIAYIATNLVRDQTADVLAGLPVIPPRETPPVRGPRRAPKQRMAATIGLVPPLAVDRVAGAHVEVGFGLHALVGMTDASTVMSISGLADIQHHHAYGAQIGGVAAIAGRANAVQIGGVFAGTAHDFRGVQIGGVAAASGRNVAGLQIGGVASVAKGNVYGAQIAGVANVADRVHGAQIGLVNVAGKMRGLQVGLINITEDGDDAYPIGLVNYAKNGRVAVEASADTTRVSSIALRHGTRHVHNVWSLGWSPDHDHVLPGVGLGFHAGLSGGLGLDVDAMAWWTDVWNGNLGQLNQLRASVSVPVGGVEVFGGAAANVYVSDEMDESANFHPVRARTWTSDGGTTVVTWPSVFAGVRLSVR